MLVVATNVHHATSVKVQRNLNQLGIVITLSTVRLPVELEDLILLVCIVKIVINLFVIAYFKDLLVAIVKVLTMTPVVIDGTLLYARFGCSTPVEIEIFLCFHNPSFLFLLTDSFVFTVAAVIIVIKVVQVSHVCDVFYEFSVVCYADICLGEAWFCVRRAKLRNGRLLRMFLDHHVIIARVINPELERRRLESFVDVFE